MMGSVTLRKIVKDYGNGFRAVHGIDLDVHEGEFMVFVGPSGCAKSTTLRMVAGLEEISSGQIMIGDRVVNDLLPKDRGIAMVFQNYALYPHKTVFDNMGFGLRMQGLPKEEIRRRVHDAAETLGITDLLDRKPKEMSGGQRQRVAVGRAIVRQPDVFLFDEPLSNLDAKLRVAMRVKIAQLHKSLKDQGKPATMIYVTHDQTEALTLGDRICVLQAGRIMQVDTPERLYRHPANKFVAGFIGSPAMNLLRATLQKSGDSYFIEIAPGRRLLIPGALAKNMDASVGREIDFGIRPEHISWAKSDHDLNVVQGEVVDVIDARLEVVEGILELVENMGNEKYLHFRIGQHLIVARISGVDIGTGDIGKRCHFNFNTQFGHMFDGETESNLLL
jgi:multiple sugar transport system ATP-binding protein